MSPRANDDQFGYVAGNDRMRFDERKASILNCLQEQVTPLRLSELATEIIQQKRGTADPIYEGGDGEHIEQVQIRLHHVDLPMLDNAGVLEYDAKQQVVSFPDELNKGSPLYE